MAVTFTIEPDEFLGLSALADLGQAAAAALAPAPAPAP